MDSLESIRRPAFSRQLVPGDHCHFNGVAIREGKPRYATALSDADWPAGWREAANGVVLDIEANDIVCRGLLTPHSPRWHQDRLWLLMSGEGLLGHIAPQRSG